MAKTSRSINPFVLLRDAWKFFLAQPALWEVLVWFLLAPVIILDVMDAYWPESAVESTQLIGQMGNGLAQFLMAFVSFWGFCCVLLVGRRMVINRAGRSRTSFVSVRRESLRLILPVFFTMLLRFFMTFYWSLLYCIAAAAFVLLYTPCRESIFTGIEPFLHALDAGDMGASKAVLANVVIACKLGFLLLPLLIPAIIYQMRTVFFAVIVASEDIGYRDALRRSRAIVHGRFWKILGIVFALTALLYIPSSILSAILDRIQVAAVPELPILHAVVDDILNGFAGLLLTLALIALYGKLRKEKGRVEEVVPDLE